MLPFEEQAAIYEELMQTFRASSQWHILPNSHRFCLSCLATAAAGLCSAADSDPRIFSEIRNICTYILRRTEKEPSHDA